MTETGSHQGYRKASLIVLVLAPTFLDVGFLQVIISAWLPSIGFTAFQVSLLIAVQGALAIASSVPLGIVSDIYGRKLILFAGALAGALGLLTFGFTTDFGYLIAASAVLGVAEGSTVAVWNALLADLVVGESRNKIFSFSFAMISVASGVGLLLPGFFPFLVGPLGLSSYSIHRSTLLLLGLLSFLSPAGIALLLWRHKETLNPERKFSGFKNLGYLAKFGIVGGAIGFGAGFIIPIVGTWFYLRFAVGDAYSGPLLAVSSILIGLAAFASPRLAKRFGQLNAIMLTTGSSMVFMLSMAFIPEVNVAALFYIVRTGLMNMSGPLMDSFSMSMFPPEQRGLVSAVTNTTFRLPNSVSTLFGGLILGLGLLELPFIIASAFYILGLVAFFFFFVANSKYRDYAKRAKDASPKPS
ncbi:MAG TPA: MFS transporter [Nitrososphaerales archaeon]|nr:MFS transporter [Nitrososphaerales archaeon]